MKTLKNVNFTAIVRSTQSKLYELVIDFTTLPVILTAAKVHLIGPAGRNLTHWQFSVQK